MNERNVILTGFMGTGKSTVGRLLAARTGREFIDTDDEVVRRAGRPISDIFAELGEPAFRRLEAAVARDLADRRGAVIATGGRLMLDPINALYLTRNADVICLTAAPQTVLARLRGDDVVRPLLKGTDPEERVRRLLAERTAGYRQFHQLATDGRPPEMLAAEIEILLAREAPVPPLSRLPIEHPGGQYDVWVGRGPLGRLQELVPLDGPLAVITDSTVGPLHAHKLDGLAPELVATMPAGEVYKTLATVRELYDRLLAAKVDRRVTIVALGGGVVGDTAGFVAATYQRGLPLIQAPTTLLAMVDASVGGKTGVDLPQGKNLVGAFKQPRAVIADLDTLDTLPAVQFQAGMAEVIKSGLLARPELLNRLEQHPLVDAQHAESSALQLTVVEAVLVKREVVEADPYEGDRRRILNLGHTFAHAVERLTEYRISHGRAVAMGLVVAAELSARLGHCSPELRQRLEAILQAHHLPTRLPAALEPETLIAAMGTDKKRSAGRLHFVLLHGPGSVFVTADVPRSDLRQALRACTAST